MSNFQFYIRFIAWNLAAVAIPVVVMYFASPPLALGIMGTIIFAPAMSLLGSRVTQWEIERISENKSKPDA